MMPVSNDTLLRVVRRRSANNSDELSVIGIDDFAFRRGQTYGTIVCDLERRRPVTLLPDRALDTSRSLQAQHQSISIVARDRGGGYGEVVAKALPDAVQVPDRWRLMENSSRAFLDAVGRSMRQIRQAVGSDVIDPKLLTYAAHHKICTAAKSASEPLLNGNQQFCLHSELRIPRTTTQGGSAENFYEIRAS